MELIKKILKFWFLILLLCVAAYLGVFNADSIELRFPGLGMYTTPKFVALLIAFFIGVTLMSLYFCVDAIKKSAEIHNLNKRIKQLQQQLGASVSYKDEKVEYKSGLDEYAPPPSID